MATAGLGGGGGPFPRRQAAREADTALGERQEEQSEAESVFKCPRGCHPRGKAEMGLRGGETGPKIVAVLTGRAAGHAPGRAARTCPCLSCCRLAPRELVEGHGVPQAPRPDPGAPGITALCVGALRAHTPSPRPRRGSGACSFLCHRNCATDVTLGGPRAPPAWALSLDAVGGAACLSKIHVISLPNPPPSHPRFLRRPPPAGREKQGVSGIGVLSAALFLRVSS